MANSLLVLLDPTWDAFTIVSPNGKYALRGTVYAYGWSSGLAVGVQYTLAIIDTETNEILIDGGIYDGILAYSAEWSSDSKYLLLNESYKQFESRLYAYDIERARYLELSLKDELLTEAKRVGVTLDAAQEEALRTPYVLSYGWESDCVLQIRLGHIQIDRMVDIGYYTYDLATDTVEYHIDFSSL